MTDQVPEFASPQEALAHYGVKGMQWGVRKPQVDAGGSSYTRKTQSTVDRLNRVASGTASRSDKAKTALGVGRMGLGGIYGLKTAGKAAAKLQGHVDRLEAGEATTMDLLKKFGRMNAADIIREASEA